MALTWNGKNWDQGCGYIKQQQQLNYPYNVYRLEYSNFVINNDTGIVHT